MSDPGRFRRYSQTPKGRYTRHKANAKQRGVAFALTFTQWWDIWQASGKWDERASDGYVMCRIGDAGPYAVGNVYIGTSGTNAAERNRIYHKRNCPFGFEVERSIAGGDVAPF